METRIGRDQPDMDSQSGNVGIDCVSQPLYIGQEARGGQGKSPKRIEDVLTDGHG